MQNSIPLFRCGSYIATTHNPLMALESLKKEKIEFMEEANLAAYEFFKVVYETALTRAHSIEDGQTVLLFDYPSDFEESKVRVQKVMSFIESLSLGRIGNKVKE